MRSSRRRPSVLVALSVAAVAGCSSEPPAPPVPTPSASAGPDQLAPGELAEGTTNAFGLPIPARLQIDDLSPTYVLAHGRVPLEQVANYVRHRVDAGNVITGPAKTVFDDVKVKTPKGKPPPPLATGTDNEQVMRVEVTAAQGVTTISCIRTLRPRFKEGLSEEQRWERTGLTKDGKPVDPKKFE